MNMAAARYLVSGGIVYFCNDADQRLYRQERGAAPAADHPGARPAARAALCRRRDRRRPRPDDLGARGPHHRRPGAGQHARRNSARRVAAISASCNPGGTSTRRRGSAPTEAGSPGSNGATRACRGSAANCGSASSAGTARSGDKRRVAGGDDELVFQPEWSPDGTLYFVSDRAQDGLDGRWWNLFRAVGARCRAGVAAGGRVRPGAMESSGCRPMPSSRRNGSSAAMCKTAFIA